MIVHIVLQYSDDDTEHKFHSVYGVYTSDADAQKAIDKAPKALSIVTGFDYVTVEQEVVYTPPKV